MNRCKDWIDQAKRDLERARLDMQYKFYEWACFTSQQSAEKSIKAVCLKLGIDAWGHSITNIIKFLEEKIEIPIDLVESAQMLDTFYIPTRYPNGFSAGKPGDYYNRKIAMEALNAAEAIFRFCEVHINQ